MLHLQGQKIDRERIKRTVRFLQTTSPSYILLASLDLVRRQMALRGEKLWQEVIDLAGEVGDFLEKSKFRYLAREYLNKKNFDLDPTIIVVEVENGFEAWQILNQNKIEPEFATLDHLIFIFGIGNNKKDIHSFLKAIKEISPKKNPRTIKYPAIAPQISLSPREASLKETEEIKIEKAIGRIAAETLTPYPPGIPLLVPGEIIAQEIVDYLKEINEYSSIKMQILGNSEVIKVIK